MLVLKRNCQQSIKVGDDIIITVLDVGNGWAKLGIKAPREIPVVRPDALRKEPKPCE